MFGARSISRDEGQVDVGFHRGRQLALGLFRTFLEALQGHLVAAQVNALLFLEFVSHVVNDQLVKVLATEEGVTVG